MPQCEQFSLDNVVGGLTASTARPEEQGPESPCYPFLGKCAVWHRSSVKDLFCCHLSLPPVLLLFSMLSLLSIMLLLLLLLLSLLLFFVVVPAAAGVDVVAVDSFLTMKEKRMMSALGTIDFFKRG